jgi:hypothetical protein
MGCRRGGLLRHNHIGEKNGKNNRITLRAAIECQSRGQRKSAMKLARPIQDERHSEKALAWPYNRTPRTVGEAFFRSIRSQL